jgi:hypothetical protein
MNIDLTNLATVPNILIAGAGSAVLALLTGKTLRRLLLLPFKLIAAKTTTKEDDVLVEEAAKDLGLPVNAAQPVEEKPDASS